METSDNREFNIALDRKQKPHHFTRGHSPPLKKDDQVQVIAIDKGAAVTVTARRPQLYSRSPSGPDWPCRHLLHAAEKLATSSFVARLVQYILRNSEV